MNFFGQQILFRPGQKKAGARNQSPVQFRLFKRRTSDYAPVSVLSFPEVLPAAAEFFVWP
jgi:hypothetical protein